jgi:glycolate oxidase iron-sulfur subunit
VHHISRKAESLAAARRNIDAWMREIEGAGLNAIAITTSGCDVTVKDYGFLLRDASGGCAATRFNPARCATDLQKL